MYDFTKYSNNLYKATKGPVTPDDLEFEIVNEWKLDNTDLPLLEKEVNKVQRKRRKA